jgi:predicted nucleotidyltransferase
VLLPEQTRALRELRDCCQAIGTDMVVIGAMALRVWLPDMQRATEDIDAAVTLDLDQLPQLTEQLTAAGWRQDPRSEHRWYSRENARFDLLPIGEQARREKHLFWPRAETLMQAIGYDYVFRDAVEHEFAPDLEVRVAPLVVMALLKIAAYLDDPHARRKDLQDLVTLLRGYEEAGDRRFSDDVLNAGVEYDEAGAYLLGRDLKSLVATGAEADVIERFIQRVCDADFQAPVALFPFIAVAEDGTSPLAREFAAFARGFQADEPEGRRLSST